MKSVPGTLFFKVMNPQPEEHHWSSMQSYKLHLKIMQTSKGPYLRVSHTIAENPMEDGVQWIKPPYLVGEKCYVPEAWGVGSRPHPYEGCIDGIEYKADEQYLDEHDDLPLYQVKTPDDIDLCDYASGWKSPVTMPQWAARRFVTILSCEPVRVSEVTEEDAIRLGFTFDEHNQVMARESFENDWHKRHPGAWAWRVVSEEEK